MIGLHSEAFWALFSLVLGVSGSLVGHKLGGATVVAFRVKDTAHGASQTDSFSG